MSKRKIQKILDYLRENIEDFDLRVELALGRMDRSHMTLDSDLAVDIEEYAREWAYDYDSPLPEDFSPEEFLITALAM